MRYPRMTRSCCVALAAALMWLYARGGGPAAADDAALLAEMLVVDGDHGGSPFWADEAKALLAGLVLFVAVKERGERRTLLAVRDLLTLGKAEHSAANPVEGLHAAYQRGENDEFVLPTLITDDLHPAVTIRDGDTVLFMNFRPDRAREMTRALVDKDFSGFSRTAHPALGAFVMTTEYAADIQADCAFPPEDLHNTLGEYLSNRGMTQLRIAETEKYAHVTFFFNGGQETLFRGEDRILIPSPKVATYDLKPEMSAYELTDELVKAITGCQYDVIICNYANCDQVGHSGVFDAAVKAVEVVDACLDRVLEALRQTGGECLITADHGNVEQMFDKESGQVHTQHTTLPVPLTYVGQRPLMLMENGSLADVAATLLDLLDLPPPPEMTGHSLVSFAR